MNVDILAMGSMMTSHLRSDLIIAPDVMENRLHMGQHWVAETICTFILKVAFQRQYSNL